MNDCNVLLAVVNKSSGAGEGGDEFYNSKHIISNILFALRYQNNSTDMTLHVSKKNFVFVFVYLVVWLVFILVGGEGVFIMCDFFWRGPLDNTFIHNTGIS